MQMVRLHKVPCSENSFTEGIDMLKKISEPKKSSVLTGILHLICWKNFGDPDAKKSLEKYHDPGLSFTNVLVIAGKSGSMEQKEHEKYENYLKDALRDFEGTVICGGTNTGLPGIVGTLTAKLRKTDSANYSLLGFMPEKLPDNVTKGSGYDRYIDLRNR